MSHKKKRRSFLKRAVITATSLGIVPLTAKAQPKIDGRFVHMVFFWLKEPNNETFVDDFITGTRSFLSEIEVIKTIHIGRPAGTPREVVDNSYTVALVVTFDSKEDQDIYQEHQAHLQYIEDRKHMWTKVQVYDSWGVS